MVLDLPRHTGLGTHRRTGVEHGIKDFSRPENQRGFPKGGRVLERKSKQFSLGKVYEIL